MNAPEPTLVGRVAAGRPTDDALTQNWPEEDRDALLARVLDEARPRPSRRRSAWLVAAAAAVVGALALVPPVGGGGDASARSTILRLAAVAADADLPVIAPGTYLHVKISTVQHNGPELDEPEPTYYVDHESWTAWDGAKWTISTYPTRRYREYHQLPAPDGTLREPTAEFVASLPDDPQAFRQLLDPNVSGSSSHEEALFEAVSNLVRSRLLTPAKLSVALESIADLEQIDVEYVQVDDREAVQISFHENSDTQDSFTIDSRTAHLVETAFVGPQVDYISTTTVQEPVDAVPTGVLAAIERHGDGQTVCFDGTPVDRDAGTC